MRDPKTGRFCRSDAKPVLHRQVVMSDDGKASVTVSASDMQGNPVSLEGCSFRLNTSKQPAPKPDPHGPRLDAWLVILIAVALLAATVLAIAAAAFDGGVL